MLARMMYYPKLMLIGICLVVASATWGYFTYTDYRERLAIDARMAIARTKGEELRVKNSARFPDYRAQIIREMRDAISSGAKIGVAAKAAEFESVADNEYLTLLKQVRDMDLTKTNAVETAQQDERANLAITYARLIRKQAHDPDSVEFTSVFMSYESNAICYRYRARNGFNALRQAAFMITSKGELKDESSKGFSAAWNRDCVNKNGQEARAAANIYK